MRNALGLLAGLALPAAAAAQGNGNYFQYAGDGRPGVTIIILHTWAPASPSPASPSPATFAPIGYANGYAGNGYGSAGYAQPAVFFQPNYVYSSLYTRPQFQRAGFLNLNLGLRVGRGGGCPGGVCLP